MKTVFNVVLVVDHGDRESQLTFIELQCAVKNKLLDLTEVPELGYKADTIIIEADCWEAKNERV